METFYKMVYHPEDKSMEGWYYLKSETEKTLVVINVQEVESSRPPWFSGQVDYNLKGHEVTLPKSQIQIIKNHENKGGYSLIKIPYWLYKKNEGLEIKRISVPKKFTMKEGDPLIPHLTSSLYREALEGLETDMNHVDLVLKLKG